MYNFFSSYLENRHQVVVMDDISSTPQLVRMGVPQGSVLGPMLFSLFVNDLPKALTCADLVMYADDMALVVTGDNEQEIQAIINTELEIIARWFSLNRLTINAKKTKYMIFHSRNKNVRKELVEISVNNCLLAHVDSIKYLGVVMDTHLHWQNHVDALCAKLASACYALLQARDLFDTKILKTLYYALFNSHLSYCMVSWGWTYNTYLNPIRRLQKRAVRTITRSKRDAPSKPLFDALQVLTFDQLRLKNTAELVHRILNYSHPLDRSIFYTSLRQTRSSAVGNLNLAPVSNVYGQRLLQFIGAKIWNEIPLEIKESKRFSYSMKIHLHKVT